MRKNGLRAFLITFLAGLSGLAGLAAPAMAQEAGQEAGQDIFSDSLDVQAVNLQVVVTDKKGNLVKGLTAADFRLLVDGKEMPLEYFAEIEGGQALPAASLAEAGAASADPPSGPALPPPPSLEAGEPMGNSYLVFVDEYHSAFPLRNEALRGMAREVATMRPQDRMAVVAYDGRQVRVLSPWVPPGEPLRLLLEKLATNKGFLADSSLTFRDLDPSADRMLEVYGNNLSRAYESLGWGDGTASSPMSEMAMGNVVLRNIRKAVSAASASLRAFSAAPGRKVMLLLSGGWRYDLVGGVGTNWDLVQEVMSAKDGDQLLEPLMDTGNLLGFTIYPIHLAHSPTSLPDASSRETFLGTHVGNMMFLSYVVNQSSMLITAAETGGKMLVPGRNRHLAKVLADTSDYYWLGFTHSGDDRRHEIKVEVKRPKLKVRSRTSFVPLSRVARVAMEVESALMTGQMAGMGALGVSVGELRKVGMNRAELSVTVRVPADKITLVPQSGRYVARLELRVGALDDYGDRSDVPVLPIEISQPQPPKPGTFVRYDATLQLRYSPQDVQFVLYDLLSGESFAERVRVEP